MKSSGRRPPGLRLAGGYQTDVQIPRSAAGAGRAGAPGALPGSLGNVGTRDGVGVGGRLKVRGCGGEGRVCQQASSEPLWKEGLCSETEF